mmetsp:Transcript_19556/g.34389  ORF Transcript_19556/g.34389 Transcript_19556/m.34389 type:complete len:244 (-) Transcript_19556:29-760(-)
MSFSFTTASAKCVPAVAAACVTARRATATATSRHYASSYSNRRRSIFTSTASSLFSSSPVTKSHGESRILRTHPLHLFRIIQDVDQYQHFLPLCTYSKVLRVLQGGRQFEAKLIVGKVWKEEYTSRVTVLPEQLRIETTSTDCRHGMFDFLKSSWQLRRVCLGEAGHGDDYGDGNAQDEALHLKHIGCHIDFQVEMTVSDPVVVAILDKLLMQVAGHQVEAFEKRCQQLPLPLELIQQVEQLK